jgi:error-prone DNA polymerase
LSAAQRAGALPGADNSGGGIREQAARQSQAAAAVEPVDIQLALDLGDAPIDPLVGGSTHGLPELTAAEQVRAELEVLGLDASRHVLSGYEPFLATLPLTRARDLLRRRTHSQVLVAGVKVATQTPPIRSGRRVVFVTLDDATGPLDATFFDTAQAGYAATLFHSWLLVIRGTLRRTGPRGISLNASGCWDLTVLHDAWERGGPAAVEELMNRRPVGFEAVSDAAVAGAASSRSSRPVMARPPRPSGAGSTIHPIGFEQSPYADVAPAGPEPARPPRKLWHSSPGSSGA